jgi:hypothetical protein
MSKTRSLAVLLVAGFFISFGAMYSGDRADAQGDKALHIDIPVKLEKAKVVFDIGHLVLNGDLPFFTGDMDLLVSDLSDWNVKGEVIAVFHGDPAPLVLNDDAYNANRHVQTGHPVHTGNRITAMHLAIGEPLPQFSPIRFHKRQRVTRNQAMHHTS